MNIYRLLFSLTLAEIKLEVLKDYSKFTLDARVDLLRQSLCGVFPLTKACRQAMLLEHDDHTGEDSR